MRWPFSRFEIAEESMAPTYQPGDFVLTIRRRIRPGSVVVFDHDGMTLIKRVVALGGSQVAIDGGVVLVDGAPTEDEWSAATRPDGEWQVPDDHLFVLGDNRPFSTSDSREIGPVPRERVRGVVVWRYWLAPT